MAFVFSLETLLTVARMHEEQALLRLGKEQQTLTNHQRRLEEFSDQRLAMMAELEQKKKESLEAVRYIFYVDSIHAKEYQIMLQQETIAAQQHVVEEARLALAEKMKERKVLERAREKQYQKYLQEMRLKEQNEADEMAVLRFGRH